MFPEYTAWLLKVNDILKANWGIETIQVWQADWHFDWYQSWVAGCLPYMAAEDAIAELRDRGILDEVQETAEAERLAQIAEYERNEPSDPDEIDFWI